MDKIKVTVSIDDAHIDQIQKVAQELGSAGMNVEQSLPNIGVVTGLVNPDQVESLYQVEGIQAVEVDRSYQLAPPESDVQ